MDLFCPRLKKREYKYSIHNDNRFIHTLPEKKEFKYLFWVRIDLFPLCLSKKHVNIEFTMIMDLFTFYFRGEKCKYRIPNGNEVIHPLPEK